MVGRIPRFLLLSLLLPLSGGSDCFREFPWLETIPDAQTDRLCVEAAAPDQAADTTFIDCRIEGASFAPAEVAPRQEIVVLAYNILRGFQADAQLDVLLNHPDVPTPDVLLLSEVDRGCRRTGFRNIARDYAETLGYHYVYATEFVELPGARGETGPYDPPICEHGNAIVSRYPLGNVRQIRHASQWNWYTPPSFPTPDEPRLGGRVALAADMKVGSVWVRLYALHLESTLAATLLRDEQAVEIAEDAANVWWPTVVGGDLNSFSYVLDLALGATTDGTTQAFLTTGFADAHIGISHVDRPTAFDPVPQIIDIIFVRGAATTDAFICPVAVCDGLSDHLPVWTTVVLPPCGDADLDCDGVANPVDACPLLWSPQPAGDGCPAGS